MTACKIYISCPARVLVLAIVLVGVAATANAKLKTTPPKNISLDGHWQIDSQNSDDATAVFDTVYEPPHQNSQNHGGGGGSSGGLGGHRGHGRQDTSANRSDRSDDAVDSGTRSASRQKLPSDLAKNPEALRISSKDHALRIATDANVEECEGGQKVSIIDGNGSSERQCGWDGRAWVIETAYSHSFTRTDRYEISKDGRQLVYGTKVSGGRMPSLALKRIYTIATPATAAPKS